MTEIEIRKAVELVTESGPRTHAMIILKLDDKGEAQTFFQGHTVHFCFLKEVLSGFVHTLIKGDIKPHGQ